MNIYKGWFAEEFHIDSGKKMIAFLHNEKDLFTGVKGSYGVIAARLMNLSYTDYLRMCRDKYGAELRGKEGLYIVPFFADVKLCNALLKELNRRWNIVVAAKKKQLGEIV